MRYPKINQTRKETIILDEYVLVFWSRRTKDWYTNLGYEFTKIGADFFCHIDDLMNCSAVPVLCECPICGETRTVKYKGLRRSGHTICMGCAKIDDLMGEKFNRWTVLDIDYESIRTGELKWICECECGERKSISGASLRTGKSKSCGCLSVDYWVKRRSGQPKNNRRGDSRYICWRKAVWERDEYICQACEANHGDIVAHHLNGFNDYDDKRFDINNGITLCRKCHHDFHVGFMGHWAVRVTERDYYLWKKKMNFSQKTIRTRLLPEAISWHGR